jgi:hypothetical protein
VEPGDVQQMTGLMDLTGRLTWVVGPASAGLLLAVMPAQGLFLVDSSRNFYGRSRRRVGFGHSCGPEGILSSEGLKQRVFGTDRVREIRTGIAGGGSA